MAENRAASPRSSAALDHLQALACRALSLVSTSTPFVVMSSSKAAKKPSKREEAWETMFEGLVQWKKDHDDFVIPRNHKHNGKCLYDWVRKQREGYRNSLKKPKLWPSLSPDKIERFRAIGFDLTINGRYLSLTGFQQPEETPEDRKNRSKSYSKQWDIMYKGLTDFRAKTGHLNVPKGYLSGSKNLYIWCQAQRQYYRTFLHKDTKPTPWQSRIDRLRGIGFDLPITKAEGEEEVELVLEDEEEGEDDEEPELQALDANASSLAPADFPTDEPHAKKHKLDESPPMPLLPPQQPEPVPPAEEEAPEQPVVLALENEEYEANEANEPAPEPVLPLDDATLADPSAGQDALALLAGAATGH